jgi:endo-alpha-1,4-polygalactosaminidase (GH114 family)
VDHVVDYVAQLMREGKVDGVFLDNTSAKLWGNLSKWSTWEQSERDAWTAGSIDLVRRLDEKRRKINPRFLIVTNGFWDRGDKMGFAGEQYVDGVMLEHSRFDEWHKRYAARNFSNLGHRRVLVIARDAEDAQLWARWPGVTHVSDQDKYDSPNKPPVPFSNPGGANAGR